MHKVFITIAIALMAFTASAQTREGKTFIQEQKVTENKETGYTYKDNSGNIYNIYISKTGSCYILKTSKKTGKEYRKYLGKEISSQICAELGIQYSPKN